MSRRFVAWSFPALLLALALESAAQRTQPTVDQTARTFIINGSLRRNDTGEALDMIKVDLRRFTGETVGSAFTRSNGEFEFSGLGRGNYYIIVEEQGYEPVREQVEIFNADRRGVVLYLTRPLTITITPGGRSISARELSLPKKARDFYSKGRERLLDKRDSKGSIPLFERAIAALPTYYEAYHMMGVAYAQMGQPDDAVAAYQKAIELSGDKFAEAYVSLAGLLCDQKKFADAEKWARKSVELDPGDWQGHFHLARALFGLNQIADAEQSLQEASTRKADFADFHLLFANIHIRRKDYTALLKDLDEYLRLAPDGPFGLEAREMRETVRRQLAAQAAPAAPPKP